MLFLVIAHQQLQTALPLLGQVKEVALMHSEGILAGEMKHGPLALVDEKLPIIVVATRDRMRGKMVSVLQQLLARGAQLIVLCNEGDADIQDMCGKSCRLISVRDTARHLPRMGCNSAGLMVEVRGSAS